MEKVVLTIVSCSSLAGCYFVNRKLERLESQQRSLIAIQIAKEIYKFEKKLDNAKKNKKETGIYEEISVAEKKYHNMINQIIERLQEDTL